MPSVTHVLQVVENLHEKGVTYTFTPECEEELDRINENYIDCINQAIIEGLTPPQSKKIDLVLRLAVPIHVLTSILSDLLRGSQPAPPAHEIKKETLDAAFAFVKYVESQKETFLTVSY